MKILMIGDVHPEVHSLNDCSALMQFVLEVAEQTHPDYLLFLGDQHHNHALLHLEVLAFWKSTFKAFNQRGRYKILALVGNHDMTGVEGSTANAMMAYSGDPGVKVVDKPIALDGLLLMPYYSDHQAFVSECQRHDCSTLICHQTFSGAVYDNGFYAADGIDPNLIPQEQIIAGHIHTSTSFGKCLYLGSPRWRTASDANVEKAIWLMKFEGGKLMEQTPFDTGSVCKRIWRLTDTPENPITQVLEGKDEWRLDIKGPPEYVERRKKELQAPGVRVKCFPSQQSTLNQVRESDGIGTAFGKYLNRYEPKHGTPKQTLEAMVKERIG